MNFTLLVLMEIGMHTLQFTYLVFLIGFWRHNCTTLHIMKVYFV